MTPPKTYKSWQTTGDTRWQAKALCRSVVEADKFHPETGSERLARLNHPEVFAMCDACPVKRTCYEAGVRNKEYGVWGGRLMFGDGKRNQRAAEEVGGTVRKERLSVVSIHSPQQC